MSIGAVFRGFLVDIGVSIAAPIVLEILSALGGGYRGVSSRDAYLIFTLVLGFIATVVGGYVAGSRAGFRETLHGAGVGALGLILGVAFFVYVPAAFPQWFVVASFLLNVPSGAVGGYLAWALRPS